MHRFLTAITFILLISLLACGGGNGSSSQSTQTTQPVTQPVSVTLSEITVTMDTSADLNSPDVHNFSATVQNAADSGLIWAVNGVVGGDGMTAHGTVTSSGAYTAPAWIPPDRITVTATSRQDPTKSAAATVTLRWYVSSISVSPAGATVKTGEQLKVDGYVSCKGPSTLTWTINGIRVGSAQFGALTTSTSWPNSIFYTAPSVKPTVPITLTATSDANPSKSVSMTITVADSDPSDPSLSISPPAPTLEVGATQQFSASLTNSAGTPGWGVTGASKLVNGFITGSGMSVTYTAPYEVPADKVVVMASLSGYTTKYAYAIVDVTPPAVSPNTRINGRYAVQLSDAQHTTHLLGVVTADGNGNLTGTADVNTTSGFLPGQSFSGTYSLGADGRGSATISYTPAPGLTVPLTLRLMLQSDSLAFLYTQDTYLGQTTGTLEKQAAVAYDKSVFTGPFVFLLRGLDVTTGSTPPMTLTAAPMAAAGILTGDGSGGLSGTAEEQGATSTNSLTGTYTLWASGQGNITLNISGGGTSHFAFSMVSPQKFYLMTTDPVTAPNTNPALLIGTAEQQQNGPFALNLLSGPFVFYDYGPNWAQLARFESGGDGNLSNGLLDYRDWSGSSVSVSPYAGLAFTGSYTLASNGRGTISLTDANNSTASGVFYMISGSKFFLLFPVGKTAAAGEGFAQQQAMANFDWTTASDRYALQMSGPINLGVGWIAPGAGWLGWIDYSGSVKNEASLLFNSYSADVNGTGSLSLSVGTPMMRYYMVSDSQVFAISTYQDLEPNDFIVLRKVQ